MCDTGSVISSIVGGASPGARATGLQLPGSGSGGGLSLGSFLPLGEGLFGAATAGSSVTEASESSGRRVAQIGFDADIRTEQTKQIQDRRLGGQRAAFAKSGIKATGTAKRLLEEQIQQDEIELLKITHNRDIGIQEERESVQRARLQGASSATQSISGGINDYFKLGQ